MNKRIGELLRETGHLTEKQLAEALSVKSRPGEKRLLGQILVARGLASVPQVQVALAKQQGRL